MLRRADGDFLARLSLVLTSRGIIYGSIANHGGGHEYSRMQTGSIPQYHLPMIPASRASVYSSCPHPRRWPLLGLHLPAWGIAIVRVDDRAPLAVGQLR